VYNGDIFKDGPAADAIVSVIAIMSTDRSYQNLSLEFILQDSFSQDTQLPLVHDKTISPADSLSSPRVICPAFSITDSVKQLFQSRRLKTKLIQYIYI
jgi:hypothetical protein